MLFWPLHESLPSNRQSEQQCDWGISGSYDRQSVTQRRPCLLNMSLWNWQTTFFRHRQRATIDCTSHLCVSSCEICLLSTTTALSPHQSSATISCIIYNCFLFLFFHPAKPVTVQTAFRLTRMLTQGVFVLVSRAGVVYYVNQRKGKRRRVASGPLYTRKGVSWRKPVLWTRGINMQIWLAWNVCNFVATSCVCVYIYITCSLTTLSEWCPVWSHPSEAVIIINGSECFCSFTTKRESRVLKSKKYNFI